MGRAMFLTNAGTSPNMLHTSPAYLKYPMRAMSMAAAAATQSRFALPSDASTRRAQNQLVSAMNMRSRTYFGSPQA